MLLGSLLAQYEEELIAVGEEAESLSFAYRALKNWTFTDFVLALQKEVEDRLSEALLSGQIQLGDKVTLGASKGKITLNVRAPKAPKTEAKELQTV